MGPEECLHKFVASHSTLLIRSRCGPIVHHVRLNYKGSQVLSILSPSHICFKGSFDRTILAIHCQLLSRYVLAAMYLSRVTPKSDLVITACKGPSTTPREFKIIMSSNKVQALLPNTSRLIRLHQSPIKANKSALDYPKAQTADAHHSSSNSSDKAVHGSLSSASADGKANGTCKSFHPDSKALDSPSPALQGWLAQGQKEDPWSAAERFQRQNGGPRK